MARIIFPSNPSNGQKFTDAGRTYEYVASKNQWKSVGDVAVSSSKIAELEADISAAGTTSYANSSALPLTGVEVGEFGFTQDKKGLYVWEGSKWLRVYAGNDTDPTWATELSANGYTLASNGTPTIVTVSATDPEGFPISYVAQTNPTNQTQATITQSNAQFTVTPSSNTDHAGTFTLRIIASDGVRSITSSASFVLQFIPDWAFAATSAVDTMPGQTYNHGTEIYRSQGILLSPDGTKLYVSDESGNGNIRTYPLSTAYDISSSSVGTYSAGQTYIYAKGCFRFNGDGTTVWYVKRSNNQQIYATNLTNAYDVTARDGNEYNAGTFFGAETICFTFDRTGDKVYVVTSNGNLRAWTLSTAYDISSLTYASPLYSTTCSSVFGAQANSIQFNQLGTVLYGLALSGAFYSVPLSTAYDISSSSVGTAVSETPAGTGTESSAFYIPDNGQHVYVVRGSPTNTNSVKTSRYTI